MSMDIPVSFESEGMNYRGTLTSVHGAGAQVYHLMISKRYNGRLRITERYGWVFDPTRKTVTIKVLTDYFGDVVTAWHQ